LQPFKELVSEDIKEGGEDTGEGDDSEAGHNKAE
jgi:hypothetical protein